MAQGLPSLDGSDVALLLLWNSRIFLKVLIKSDYLILRNDLLYLCYGFLTFRLE